MKKIIRLTERDLTRIVKRVLNEGEIASAAANTMSGSAFKVGQTFDEITNRGYIYGRSYQLASSGLGSGVLNDFSFTDPKVVEVTSERVKFKLDYGYYNPNEIWKKGQKDTKWTNFCLSIPKKYITMPIKENQVQIQVSNHTLSLYKKVC